MVVHGLYACLNGVTLVANVGGCRICGYAPVIQNLRNVMDFFCRNMFGGAEQEIVVLRAVIVLIEAANFLQGMVSDF